MEIADRWATDEEDKQYEIIVVDDGVERVVTLEEWLNEKE